MTEHQNNEAISFAEECKLVVRRQILARDKTIELESMIETYIVATTQEPIFQKRGKYYRKKQTTF